MTCAGDCSAMTMSATLWQYVSQSGFAMLSALASRSVLQQRRRGRQNNAIHTCQTTTACD